MARCEQCNSLLLISRVKYADWTFCSDRCVTAMKVGLTQRFIPAADIAASLDQLFHGACGKCRGPGPVDIFTCNTVTGMLVAYQVKTISALTCARCARKAKLGAAGHCLLLGWWGVHSFIHNLIYLPKNILGAALVKAPTKPSKLMAESMLVRLAELNIATFKQALAGAAGAPAAPAGAAAPAQAKLLEEKPNPFREGV